MSSALPDAGRRTALLVLTAAGLSVAARPLVRDALPSDRLHLTEVWAAADGPRFTVRAVVVGSSRVGTRLRVWCTLTPVGEEAGSTPWRSGVRSAALAVGGTPVELRATPAVAPGAHHLDLWLHAKRRNRFVHHDHRRVPVLLA